MNTTPKISVIVPVYNAEKYLHRCIDSILSQTFTDFELLLINDGSKDSSGAICDEYAAKDNRVRVFHKENCGVSSARNLGIVNSIAEFVVLIDSDDWFALDTLEVLLKEQKKYDADCVVFGFNQTSGNIWAPNEDKVYDTLSELKNNFVYHLNTELLSSSVNKLYKKKLIKQHYPVGMAFGEDLLFSLDYLEQCKCISFITAPLYQHEVYNNTSLTHTFNMRRFVDIEIIQNRIIEFAIDKNNKSLNRKYLADCIRIIRSFLSLDISISEKRNKLDSWLNNSYFKNLRVKEYELIWQNRLLLTAIQNRCYIVANLLVNWKKIIGVK